MVYKDDKHRYESYSASSHDIFSGVDGAGVVASAIAGAAVMGVMAPSYLGVGVLPCALAGAVVGGVVYGAAPVVIGLGKMAVGLTEGVVSLFTKDKQKSKRNSYEKDKYVAKPKESFSKRMKDFFLLNEEAKWMVGGATIGAIAGALGAPYLGLTGATLSETLTAGGVLAGVGAAGGAGVGFASKLATDLVADAYYGVKNIISDIKAEKQWKSKEMVAKKERIAPIQPQYEGGKVFEKREAHTPTTAVKTEKKVVLSNRNVSRDR